MALGHILSKSISRNERFEAYVTRPPASLSKNLNRLVSAAIVSPRFQQLLLADPAAALEAGYNGEEFHLTPVEHAVVMAVKGDNLRDFAAQLIDRFQATSAEVPLYTPAAKTEYRMAKVAMR